MLLFAKMISNAMATLFDTAKTLMPGGVNSPVRAFQSVGGEPLYITGAQGAYLNDASNRQFIDYVGGFGPMILGHSRPEVVAAIQKAAAKGLTYGTCNPLEVEMSGQIINAIDRDVTHGQLRY